MGRRHRRFDEKKVVRWPAHSPASKGGEFAPKHVPMPRWAVAVAARLPGAKAKKVARRGTFIGNVPATHGNARPRPEGAPARTERGPAHTAVKPVRRPGLADDKAAVVARHNGATPTGRVMAERLTALGDVERARAVYRELSVGQSTAIRRHLGVRLEDDRVTEAAVLTELYLPHLLRTPPARAAGGPAAPRKRGAFPRTPYEGAYAIGQDRGITSQMKVLLAPLSDQTAGPTQVAASLREAARSPRVDKHDKATLRRMADYLDPDNAGQVEPDLFDEGERRFKTTPTKRVPRERYEQTQLVDTSGGRQRPGQGAPAPGGDVARMEAYQQAAAQLDAFTVSDRGREYAMRKLGALTLGVSARDVATVLRDGIGRSGHTKKDNAALAAIADRLERGPDRQVEVENRIRAAYRELARRPHSPVLLSDIRDRLPDVDREEMDRVLTEMYASQRANIVPKSDRGNLQPRDRAAGLHLGGEDKHQIIFEDDASDRLLPIVTSDEPPFTEPPHPDSSRDPAVLFDQAVEYATAMAAMESSPGVGRFRVLPSLTALNGLKEGVAPSDVVRQLEADAQTYPAENLGGREYLNRLARFLSRQSTTLPKAEADKQKTRRARWQAVFKAAIGEQYWRTGTRHAAGAQSDALVRLEAGNDPSEVAQDVRDSARRLRQRANEGGIQDYDRMGVLAYGADNNREVGLLDARQLDALADAIETAHDDDIGLKRNAISTVATPQFRKALVAKQAKMSRAQFDALPEAQRAQILAELEEVATSGDKRRAFRDSMGSLVRGAEAAHVTQARSLRSSLIAPARPTRDQEFDATVARLKAGDGDIPVSYSRAQLVALDQALGLGESSSGRPTTAKLRERMQTALAERRRAGGGDLEGKSRTRQALIDDARPFGDFAAEAMELIGHRASRDVMAQRLAATAQRLGIYHWVSPTITALKNGNESTARGQLTRLLKRHGVELHSPAGEIGPLDRKRHEALSGGLGADVSAVEVVRPGYTITLPGGEQVTVKARVQTHEVGPDFSHLQAIRGAKTVTELRAYARDRGVKIPAYLKRKDDIRDWLANHFTAKPGEDPDEYAARTRLGGGTPPTPVRRALTGSTLKNLQPGTRVV